MRHTLFIALFVVCNVSCQVIQIAVHEVCTSNEDCPARSTCRPTSCDGYTCLCDNGYVASEDRSQCMKASRIGDSCEDGVTRCISEYATCEVGICQCLKGFQATKDGRCKLPETNFIGEPCGNCEFPAQCIDGMCKCEGEFRSLTTEEFWVDPISVLQCRPKDYSLDACNGTSILSSSDVMLQNNVVNRPSPPSVLNANEWSLILPEKSIYEACNSHSQCPGNARCRPNSCDGFLCLCNVGFVASEDRLQCLPAVKTGATCDRRMETCLSPFAKCTTGICKCDSFFSPTNDGRCRIAKTRYIGESCRGSDECEYPGTCVNGICACVAPHRNITNEEFWIDPSLTIQCRPRGYNTWKCNGTVIDVPAQFQMDIPIDVEIELTYKKEHNGQPHDDHVEINPTIVVDEPNDDDDYLVPLHIAGILAAALFALLIACIFKTKRRKAIKRDISLTRTNILANKTLMAAEEEAVNNRHLQMENSLPMSPNQTLVHAQMAPVAQISQISAPSNTMTIPRPHMSIYNKSGWHDAYVDRSFYDNNTDIYPDSNTTTRSTGPFIVDSPKHSQPMHGVGVVAPYTINRNGPYVVDGHVNEAYIGRGTMDCQHRFPGHYANDSVDWRQECTSDNEPDLVLF